MSKDLRMEENTPSRLQEFHRSLDSYNMDFPKAARKSGTSAAVVMHTSLLSLVTGDAILTSKDVMCLC